MNDLPRLYSDPPDDDPPEGSAHDTVMAPPPKVDSVAPPVWGPIVELLRSRKFVVFLTATIVVTILWGIGRITIEQAGNFMVVVLPAWLAAHAIENIKSPPK